MIGFSFLDPAAQKKKERSFILQKQYLACWSSICEESLMQILLHPVELMNQATFCLTFGWLQTSKFWCCKPTPALFTAIKGTKWKFRSAMAVSNFHPATLKICERMWGDMNSLRRDFFAPNCGGKTTTGPSWQLHVVCALQRGYLRVTRPLRGLGLKIFIWKCDSVPGSHDISISSTAH